MVSCIAELSQIEIHLCPSLKYNLGNSAAFPFCPRDLQTLVGKFHSLDAGVAGPQPEHNSLALRALTLDGNAFTPQVDLATWVISCMA